MRINQVVLVPSFLRSDAESRIVGRYSEAEAVRAYFDPLCEHLDSDGVRFEIQKRADDPIMGNSLVIYCGMGWEKKPDLVKVNHSKIRYFTPQSKRFAEIVVETLSDWGKCYSDLLHKTREVGNDKSDMNLRRIDCFSLAIEPFALNGPRNEDYLKALPVFGKMMSLAVYEYLLSRNELARLQSACR